ncbi:hypothetical protein [Vibrio jasicida]|uniref:hypothetical protein n=1 Tax=Vibrio jasicida TaxID=766224 RepID=UPI0005EFA9CD|nr:hypothetical protein [Vibrio jasicida]
MKLRPRQSHTLDAYLTEANTLAVKKLLKKHSKTTAKVINRKLSSLVTHVLASLFEPSEATLLARQIHGYSTTLVSSFEELQRTAKMVETDLNNDSSSNLAKKLKVLSIETRQLISQLLSILEDYRRANTKGGKLTLNGKVDLKLYAQTVRKLEQMEKLCEHTSKAAAFLAIDNVEAASKQLQPIINAKL